MEALKELRPGTVCPWPERGLTTKVMSEGNYMANVLQPPLPLQEFLPLQPLSPDLQPPLPLQSFLPLQVFSPAFTLLVTTVPALTWVLAEESVVVWEA